MKKIFALLLALTMVFALCACGQSAAPAKDSKNLTMGTGGEAGTYYAFGGALGSYIGQNTDISINVVSTKGSADNITGMVTGGIYDLATVQSDVMTYAFNGADRHLQPRHQVRRRSGRPLDLRGRRGLRHLLQHRRHPGRL